MSSPFCNVALPVPLRTTFTYAIPEGLRDSLQPGTRVLVPFRKKSMVGVVVEMAEHPPANAKVREITKVMEFTPALTPKLIELAQWIANYYLAPIGEVFRAMLPPVTELNLRREIVLTAAGRGAAESLGGGEHFPRFERGGSCISRKGERTKRSGAVQLHGEDGHVVCRFATVAAARADRKLRNSARHEKKIANDCRVERICGQSRKNTERERRKGTGTARNRTRSAAASTTAQARPGIAEFGYRMLADGLLESWEEPVDPAEDPFDVGYTPPAHALNEEQRERDQ